MNLYIEQLKTAVSGRFVIEAEYSGEGLAIFCHDLEGNLITSRVFKAHQLQNAQLVRLVMMDLQRTLLYSQAHPTITPLPESLHPTAE